MQGLLTKLNPKIRLGVGLPKDNDGEDGDFALTRVDNTIRLYGKYNRGWYKIGTDLNSADKSSRKTEVISKLNINNNVALNDFKIIRR